MRLSVITINYNNKPGLEKTLKSVFTQSYKEVEYILIDGASTDGSKKLIEENADRISYWVSEPDAGIYNALNKGIEAATSEYIIFLNSGDEFYSDGFVEKLSKKINENTQILYSDIQVIDKANSFYKQYPEKLSFKYFTYDTLAHPGCLIKKSLFNLVGKYDENLKICSDWKWFIIAICRHNLSAIHSGLVGAKFNLEGISSQESSISLISKEKMEVLNKAFPMFINDYLEMKSLEEGYTKLKGSRLFRYLKKIGAF